MRKTVFLLAISFYCSTAIGFAAEPAKPKENLNQRASDAVKDIGDSMNKAGAAIKKDGRQRWQEGQSKRRQKQNR